jgi:hypothetical protein
MSAKLTHRQAVQLPLSITERIVRKGSQAAGPHADQNRRHAGKAARGGRQGARVQLRKGVQI